MNINQLDMLYFNEMFEVIMNKEHRMITYSTGQIAGMVGLHPNTVRLYEEWGLIQKPELKKNG